MSVAGPEQAGVFELVASHAHVTISNTPSGPRQTIEKESYRESLGIAYEIGSGTHAFGYIVQVGDHLFQSPLSYYTARRIWDVAPGYEDSAAPDFTRPVTVECLFCHSDRPRPVADTLNRYQTPPFAGTAIQCDRCHGSAEAHLARPVPGSIINPAKLPQRQRDSICEQCHLTGAVRIPNPGKAITDFRPGEAIEDVYTVYVAAHDSDKAIKVVSHAEQLALSLCARKSNGELWCGTCHNPHETPARPAEYYRQKCLSCHAATLEPSHRASGRDCIGCHMPRRPAKDGGHTAFTDHRITRQPEAEAGTDWNDELTAWREPEAQLRQRNLALALVTAGLQRHSAKPVIRGFQMLVKLESTFHDDDAVLTALGTILMTAKQPAEAERRFARALALRPSYAPYEVNVANALMSEGKDTEATRHLARAVELDPLLEQAVQLLRRQYLSHGEASRAAELLSRYRAAMGFSGKFGN